MSKLDLEHILAHERIQDIRNVLLAVQIGSAVLFVCGFLINEVQP